MRAFVVDAYDSFVYIICEYLEKSGIEVVVERNDQVTPAKIDESEVDFLLLGPGPGHPKDAGYIELVNHYKTSLPILGVCLGHQAIALAFGGTIGKDENPKHGKTSQIRHDETGIFRNQTNPFTATRYHSLYVDQADLPDELIVSATSLDDSKIMGLRHRDYRIESVQFHPESILTENGILLFQNFAQMG